MTLFAFRCLISRPQINSYIMLKKKCFFLKNYVTSEGADSHNVLYYRQLSFARYQVSFYGNSYFE